jgi:cell division topological specificity factor MinE
MNWLSRLTGGARKEKTAATAVVRAKAVVEFDRIQLPTGALEQIRDDIVQVISSYALISADDVSVEFVETPPRIVADIPLRGRESASPIAAPPAPGPVKG